MTTDNLLSFTLPQTGQRIILPVAIGFIIVFLTLWTAISVAIYKRKKAQGHS